MKYELLLTVPENAFIYINVLCEMKNKAKGYNNHIFQPQIVKVREDCDFAEELN